MRFSQMIKKTAAALAAAALCRTAVPSLPRADAAAAPRSAAKEVSAEVGLVCNLYVSGSGDTADNAALQWATTRSAKQYTLYRSSDPETGFLPVYQGTGSSFSDQKLTAGQPYYYQLCVSDGKSESWSGVKSVTPCAVPEGLDTYDNQKGSSLRYASGGYKVGNTYYSYSLKKHAGKNDIYLEETTSSDGKNFGNARNAADSSQNNALADCKIESVHIEYLPWANKVVVWAHWEKPSGYSDGKALVITGTPGQAFTVHHVYNPLDIEVRDMAIFFDDDAAHTGYLIAAANTHAESANATLYIFRMNESYSDVTGVVKKLFADQYREFPNLIKQNGHYFLFTSQAAGWYPSSGAYAVADDIAGEWSGLRSIGNTSTFSSQSGWIVSLQDKNYLMHAYRWLRASSSSGTTLCPLYFDGSFAFYDYYPSFRYSTATGDLYPVQAGRLLSQDCPASASISAKSGYDAAKAFDGSYQTSFTAIDENKRWPYYLQVDLGQVCDLANIQISWYICKGSEGYYTYTVEGSADGEHWTRLLDHTDKSSDTVSSTYGFNSDFLKGRARFVRLNVRDATLQNNPTNNWYTPTVYEVKIFGEPVSAAEPPVAAVQYDFESVQGSTVRDISGNGGDLTLKGGAAVFADPVRGNVLKLSADPADYAVLPAGLLDGVREYTVLMDVRSDADGDFFTFAAGQDENKYAFFKIAKDHFRFQTTTDTWKGETGFRVDLDASDWHRYCLVVSGGSAQLYADGTPLGGTVNLTTGPADMGSSLLCYFGKSFYKDDTGFAGEIDNAAVYRRALTPGEVKALCGGTAEPLRGDVNADGTVSISDAVMMQKFLLCAGTVTDWQAGDLDGDRRLSAVDFALLKRLLLSAGG